MSKHSMSPWYVDNLNPKLLRNIEGDVIAVVEKKRNLPLLTAAPELYRACKDTLDFLQSDYVQVTKIEPLIEILDRLYTALNIIEENKTIH